MISKGVDWLNVGLGTKPDSVFAKEYNLSRRDVCSVRNKLGIKPFIGIILSQEDESLRSILEAKYDAYLHWKGIAHKHDVRLDNCNYIADSVFDTLHMRMHRRKLKANEKKEF